MSTGSSRFLIVAVSALVLPASLAAAGLFVDPRSIFQSIDSTRVLLTVSQAEIDLGSYEASVLTLETRFRQGSRVGLSFALDFPAVRTTGDLRYGMGDGRISAVLKCAGDSIDLSGLFFRVSCRLPSGSNSLAPFSFGSLDGSMGLEFREKISIFEARVAALYTLTGKKARTGDMIHGRNAILAGHLLVSLPHGASIGAVASWTHLETKITRNSLLADLVLPVSSAIEFSFAGGFEKGQGELEAYESLFGFAIKYRFPLQNGPKDR